MHETFCYRNIVKCEHCGKPVDKYVALKAICNNNIILIEFLFFVLYRNVKQDHFDEFHAKIKCECGEMIEKMNLDAHKVTV